MKKLNSINWVAFKDDKVYLEDVPITIGINIIDWLKQFSSLKYSIEQADYNERRKYITFSEYLNIVISSFDDVVTDISVYPYQFQSSPYYKGDIIIFDKKLEVPFLSNDIEKYFPDIKVKRPPSKVIDRFLPREALEYVVNDRVKLEISMGRSAELVGSISLKYV
ncbi:hypothetical protein [Flavobacterium sp. N1736]|uniref:hypothetical protein n=1 Tax=Flavobacterium sp. N1736 TaxID=2986823 RepID=UPI0022250138|nr:hypothetical protein [Flavobacterium sp. N1736]